MNREKILEVKLDNGEWISLPTNEMNLKVVDYRCELLIDNCMVFDTDIELLNTFVLLAKGLNDKDAEKLNVVLSSGEYASSMSEVIDVIKNIELFEVVYGINYYYELGQYYGNGNNENYEELGIRIAEDENGIFLDNIYLSCANPNYYQESLRSK